jgi:acetyl-CoA acetyltransferase
MVWAHQDKCAIVGVGATKYYVRGQSWPRTINEMIGEAVLKACDDAGIKVEQLDGFAYYSSASAGYGEKMDTASLMEMLGIPEVGFSAAITSGGGGSAGSMGLATAALMNEDTKYCVTIMALQQYSKRLGLAYSLSDPTPESSFLQPSGLVGPGHLMSVLFRRHMHLYGTSREALGEIVISQRENAIPRETSVRRNPLTLEEYFQAPMLADPLCRLDFCLETDGAVAIITTTSDRAKDLKQKPVYIHGATHGGKAEWGRAFAWMGMPTDESFASSGHKAVADRLWKQAGVGPQDMDVALLYDHFSCMVLMQLEDYGFCKKGEGGPFVESGAVRYKGGSIPVNTHGGQLSEGYIIGMTHLREAVEQLRGVAVNQVQDAELALVTGGPAHLPVSGCVLRR